MGLAGRVKEDRSQEEISEMVPEPRGGAAPQPRGGRACRGRSGRCKGPEVGGPRPKGRPSWLRPRLRGPAISLRGLVGPSTERSLILSAGGSAEAGPDPCAHQIPLAALGREVRVWSLRAVRGQASRGALGVVVGQEGGFQIYPEGEATSCRMDGCEVRSLSWGTPRLRRRWQSSERPELGGAGGQCCLASWSLGHPLGLPGAEQVTEGSDELRESSGTLV